MYAPVTKVMQKVAMGAPLEGPAPRIPPPQTAREDGIKAAINPPTHVQVGGKNSRKDLQKKGGGFALWDKNIPLWTLAELHKFGGWSCEHGNKAHPCSCDCPLLTLYYGLRFFDGVDTAVSLNVIPTREEKPVSTRRLDVAQQAPFLDRSLHLRPGNANASMEAPHYIFAQHNNTSIYESSQCQNALQQGVSPSWNVPIPTKPVMLNGDSRSNEERRRQASAKVRGLNVTSSGYYMSAQEWGTYIQHCLRVTENNIRKKKQMINSSRMEQKQIGVDMQLMHAEALHADMQAVHADRMEHLSGLREAVMRGKKGAPTWQWFPSLVAEDSHVNAHLIDEQSLSVQLSLRAGAYSLDLNGVCTAQAVIAYQPTRSNAPVSLRFNAAGESMFPLHPPATYFRRFSVSLPFPPAPLPERTKAALEGEPLFIASGSMAEVSSDEQRIVSAAGSHPLTVERSGLHALKIACPEVGWAPREDKHYLIFLSLKYELMCK
jgi:hypothetical protein